VEAEEGIQAEELEMENPYQAAIVGKETIPRGRRGKWLFLKDIFPKIKPGQAVRLQVPLSENRSSVNTAWLRYCKMEGLKGHTREVKQVKGRVIFCWYDNPKMD